MIIGFGKTEEGQRKVVGDWIFNKVKELYIEAERENAYDGMLSDDIVSEFKKSFKQYQSEIKSEYDKAEKSNPKPERYFHIDYGVRIAWDYDTLFVKIEFWHINSQHALSPDGMSLMSYPETFAVSVDEF